MKEGHGTDVLIDLDRAPPPARRSPRRRAWGTLSAHPVRFVLAVVLLLAAVPVLNGSVVRRPARFHGPVRIAGVAPDGFVLFADGLLVRAGPWEELRNYRLDGRLRWAVQRPLPFFTLVGVIGDAVVVTSPPPGQTAVLDRATGALRWRTDGAVYAVAGDVVVLSLGGGQGSAGGLAAAPEEDFAELAGIDVRDGRERWRTPARPDGSQRRITMVNALPSDWPRTGFGLIEADGTGRLLDVRTGRWRRVTGLTPSAADHAIDFGYSAEGLTAVFSADNSGVTAVRVYGPEGESPLWSAVADDPNIFMCGPWICVPDLGWSRVLDPRTGVQQRRVGWPAVVAGTAERLLAFDTRGTIESTQIGVIDVASGRVLHRYTGWELVPAQFVDWIPLVRREVGTRWRIVALRLADGLAYPLGTFEPTDKHACRATATHVACAAHTREALVWEYRPARQGGRR